MALTLGKAKEWAGKAADYTPFVSNAKGLIEGDGAQALLGPLKPLKDDLYDAPFEDAAAANRGAADRMEQVGNQVQDNIYGDTVGALAETEPAFQYAGHLATKYDQQGPRTDAVLENSLGRLDTSAAQDSYARTIEQAGGAGNAERLFQQRMTGDDPYTAFQRDQGARKIGNAMSAAGTLNSGAALEANALMNAAITAEGARDLSNLSGLADQGMNNRLGTLIRAGGQADEFELGRAGTLGNLAGASDRTDLGRDQTAFNALLGVGGQRSDTIQRGSEGANRAWAEGQMGGIQGDLTAEQMEVERDAGFIKGALQLGGTAAGAYFGGPAGAKLGGQFGGAMGPDPYKKK